MCAQINLCIPAGESPVDGNTLYESLYRVLRGPRRRVLRSVDRDDAGRNAKPEKGSSVKGSSPDKRNLPWWPSKYVAAKAAPKWNFVSPRGTTGVQDHGMYRRNAQELGRSPGGRSKTLESTGQGIRAKSRVTPRGEVRVSRSSKEVG